MKRYAIPTVRIGLAAVFLWFGISQYSNPQQFFGYIPAFATAVASVQTIVLFNATLDTLLGAAFLLGVKIRWFAAIAVVHILSIAYSLGYNPVMVRDIGLAAAALAVFLNGEDAWSAHRIFR